MQYLVHLPPGISINCEKILHIIRIKSTFIFMIVHIQSTLNRNEQKTTNSIHLFGKRNFRQKKK